MLGTVITVVALLVTAVILLLAIGIGPRPTYNSLTVFQAKRAAMLVLLAISLAAAAIAKTQSPSITRNHGAFLVNSEDIHNLLLFAAIPTLLC
jgi:hypothetical protein